MGGTPDIAGRISVLLVDDEAALLEVTARLLRHAGMTVTPCASGEAAIARLSSERFDVVVSDLSMPGLSGIELLRLLRAQQLDVPVVLVTGAPTLDTAMKAVEYGAFKYLTKPVDRAELVATIERAAREHEVRSGPRRSAPPIEPSSDRAAIEPGAVLAERYRLRRSLGTGGMGEVWDAAHLLTGRPVALKLLHPSLNARPNMRKRLLREARAATAFAHPNVIEVFDVFELADGTPVIVMELLRGQTLRERLDRDRMADVEEACGVMVQVVSAVGTGHAHGVIHRDIKPENVMLCASGVVKVMDFGVAKLVHADPRDGTSATAVGAAVGTIGYMAPEQACGEEDIDHRADIWSVGAVLYEAIAGRRPVPGSTLGQIIAYQLTDRPAPLCDRAPEIPRELGALVDRMLEREPRARPADLREVHLEMARHTQVVAPSFGPPAPTSVRDHEAERELAKSLGSAPTILGVSPAPRRGT